MQLDDKPEEYNYYNDYKESEADFMHLQDRYDDLARIIYDDEDVALDFWGGVVKKHPAIMAKLKERLHG